MIDLKRHKQETGFLILVLTFLIAWLWQSIFPFNIPLGNLQEGLNKFPLFISSPLYIVLYVVVTFFLFFSKDIFWIAGAFIFGPFLSALLICIAEAMNAGILFYLSRLLGRGFVEKRVSGKYRRLDEKLRNFSLFWLFVFRAAPLIPYRLMDMAAGLTKMKFRRYSLAVILGTPVKMFWIQYVIYNVGKDFLRDPNLLQQFFLTHKKMLLFSMIYVIMAVMVIFKLKRKA